MPYMWKFGICQVSGEKTLTKCLFSIDKHVSPEIQPVVRTGHTSEHWSYKLLFFLTVALAFEWQGNVLPCLQTLSRIWAPDVAPYLFLGANLPSSLLDFQMRNPAIQNDFSYYRRTISRNRINNMHVSAWDSMAGIVVALWLFCLLHVAEHRGKAESLSVCRHGDFFLTTVPCLVFIS